MGKEFRIVANWKMNKTIPDACDFLKELSEETQVIMIAPPVSALYACSQAKPPILSLGAQNIHFETNGPYTGEVSAEMVHDAGAEFVILGHSERRHLFNEDDSLINKKVKHALLSGLQVILCIGETATDREGQKTADVLKSQLLQGLLELTDEQLSQVMIAYEPVWAIGTGMPATVQMAQETHHMLRSMIEEKWGTEIAENMYILHGGSINAENVSSLVSEADIDGVLVGGASLKIDSFKQIIHNSGNPQS